MVSESGGELWINTGFLWRLV